MINLNNVNVVYPTGTHAMKDVSLNVKDGEFLVIVGKSGAGKSTLLRTLNGLVKATSGSVKVFNKEVTTASKNDLRKIRSNTGMIFQTFNLVTRTTVMNNVLTGRLGEMSPFRGFFSLWSEDDKKIAMQALEEVDISEKAWTRASKLSGGQQQRVGIARALAQQPKLILADEPVASLDPVTSRKVMDYIKKINVELGITTIVNLHFLDLAKDYAERIVGMHDGNIVYDGPISNVSDKDFENIYGGQLTEDDFNDTRKN